MPVVICPGVHPPEFTQNFLTGLGCCRNQVFVLPTERYPGYLPWGILHFLQAQPLLQAPRHLPTQHLLFIAFSAGVVGAAGAANLWQKSGGTVTAIIAVDGWGVPLFNSFPKPFPVHRISHDPFTDWSSHLLGGNGDRFYADPAVSHLHLWRFPQACQGWWVQPPSRLLSGASASMASDSMLPSASTYTRITAAEFIRNLLDRYGENRYGENGDG